MMEGNELKGLMGLDELRELVEFLKANDVAQFDLEKEGMKVRLKFQGAGNEQSSLDMAQMARMLAAAQPMVGVTPTLQAAATPQALPAAAASSSTPTSTSATPPVEQHHIVKSPIVGTFYDAPSPGAAPCVKVGDTVEVGQVLCIVEAMKLMNEIEADAAGEIVERIASGGQPVEYGQALFSIRSR